MKQFLKMVLAVIVGGFVTGIIMLMFILSLAGSVATLGSTAPMLPSECMLTIDMSSITIGEQTIDDPFASLSGSISGESETSTIGIYDAILALNHAAQNPGVKFLFIKADATSGGIAELEEFRTAICNFRNSGKPVFAYMENPSNGSYYLASAADKIYMGNYQGGMNTVRGLGTQLMFLKDALDKLGVNVQLIRHGKFKSAGEMYIKNEISPENRLQNQAMIDAIWAGWAEAISSSRGMEAAQFNALIDNLELNSPDDFLTHGLVDELLSKKELAEKLATLYGVDNFSMVKSADFLDYVSAHANHNIGGKNGKIAVIYADGSIVDGQDIKDVAGDRFAKIIDKVRRDETVKAVVFRVSSPGGSVVASEKIKSEIDLLCAEKPVIASYGNYAASGGYWISNGCKYIYSNAGTLTGSIGVFSMIPDFSKTLKNIAHVNVTTITSNQHGDMMSLMRPLDQEEAAYMQASVENIYDRFTSIVSEGRGLEKSYVDDIAQGRVWAGRDALEIGLVDGIGTIEDAIRMAAAIAEDCETPDLDRWEIASYPKPLTLIEQLSIQLSGKKDDLAFATEALSDTPFSGMAESLIRLGDKNSVGKAYAMLPCLYDIK